VLEMGLAIYRLRVADQQTPNNAGVMDTWVRGRRITEEDDRSGGAVLDGGQGPC
jgi:hypothetical protein